MSSLKTKLKAAAPEIQSYVIALEKENLKLQRQIGKHQAENVTLSNRIKALEEDLEKKNDQEGGEIILNVVKAPHCVHKKEGKGKKARGRSKRTFRENQKRSGRFY